MQYFPAYKEFTMLVVVSEKLRKNEYEVHPYRLFEIYPFIEPNQLRIYL